MYNHGRDDGISWCDAPCASQLIAWKSTAKMIGDLIHNKGNLYLTNNYQTARMDLLLASDGIFSEAAYAWNSDGNGLKGGGNKNHLNAVGLSSMGMPAIMWVYSSDEILKDVDGPHQYFQQRLYMNVNLMAPVYGADHSIAPDPNVQVYYKMYGEMFKVLRGTIWWLDPDTVEIINSNGDDQILINSFRKNLNDNIVIVIALGEWNTTSIDLNITGTTVHACQSMNVESNGKWIQLNVDQNRVVNVTNIVYGCSVIECEI